MDVLKIIKHERSYGTICRSNWFTRKGATAGKKQSKNIRFKRVATGYEVQMGGNRVRSDAENQGVFKKFRYRSRALPSCKSHRSSLILCALVRGAQPGYGVVAKWERKKHQGHNR